jgi:hypothetical protein
MWEFHRNSEFLDLADVKPSDPSEYQELVNTSLLKRLFEREWEKVFNPASIQKLTGLHRGAQPGGFGHYLSPNLLDKRYLAELSNIFPFDVYGLLSEIISHDPLGLSLPMDPLDAKGLLDLSVRARRLYRAKARHLRNLSRTSPVNLSIVVSQRGGEM